MKTVEEFQALVERAERVAERLESLDKGSAMAALTTEVQANGAALADVLEAMSKQTPDFAAQITKALAGLTVKAGDVNPQITVQVPEIKLPVIPSAAKTRTVVMEIDRAPNGQAKRYLIKID